MDCKVFQMGSSEASAASMRAFVVAESVVPVRCEPIGGGREAECSGVRLWFARPGAEAARVAGALDRCRQALFSVEGR